MTLAADFKTAFRSVRRGGWLSLTVVMILAVAIGAVTAIFSIAHAVLIRPLPVADPDRVMLLWGRDDARSQQVVEVSLLDQRAWLAGQKSFAAIELFGSVNWGELHVVGPGQPFRAVQNAVSSGFFDVLGARPMLGRTFGPADDVRGGRPTVVLSADVWRQQFSSDPSVVGRLLTVGKGKKVVAFEVIGVMPPEFRIPAGAQVWVALGPRSRPKPGATVENAVAELSIIARNVELKNGMAKRPMAYMARTPSTCHPCSAAARCQRRRLDCAGGTRNRGARRMDPATVSRVDAVWRRTRRCSDVRRRAAAARHCVRVVRLSACATRRTHRPGRGPAHGLAPWKLFVIRVIGVP